MSFHCRKQPSVRVPQLSLSFAVLICTSPVVPPRHLSYNSLVFQLTLSLPFCVSNSPQCHLSYNSLVFQLTLSLPFCVSNSPQCHLSYNSLVFQLTLSLPFCVSNSPQCHLSYNSLVFQLTLSLPFCVSNSPQCHLSYNSLVFQLTPSLPFCVSNSPSIIFHLGEVSRPFPLQSKWQFNPVKKLTNSHKGQHVFLESVTHSWPAFPVNKTNSSRNKTHNRTNSSKLVISIVLGSSGQEDQTWNIQCHLLKQTNEFLCCWYWQMAEQ